MVFENLEVPKGPKYQVLDLTLPYLPAKLAYYCFMVQDTRFLRQRQGTLLLIAQQAASPSASLSQFPLLAKPHVVGAEGPGICLRVQWDALQERSTELGKCPMLQKAISKSDLCPKGRCHLIPQGCSLRITRIMSGHSLNSWHYLARTCRYTRDPWQTATPNTRCITHESLGCTLPELTNFNMRKCLDTEKQGARP